MTNSEYFLRLEKILYFPDIDYIPYESIYYKLNTDWDLSKNNTINSVIDVRNQNRILNILIDKRYIDGVFFKNLHKMNVDNIVLPPNCVCVIYYSKNDLRKQYYWNHWNREYRFQCM